VQLLLLLVLLRQLPTQGPLPLRVWTQASFTPWWIRRRNARRNVRQRNAARRHENTMKYGGKGKGKVLPYSLPSVGPWGDSGVQAVSPQVTELSTWRYIHSFIHQGRRLAVGSLSTCLQPTASAEA